MRYWRVNFPFRGLPLSSRCPVVLKVQKALGDSVEIGKVIGRQDLPLHHGEVHFNAIEPTGMNRRMYERLAGDMRTKVPIQLPFWGGVSPPQPMRSIVFFSLVAVQPGNALIPRGPDHCERPAARLRRSAHPARTTEATVVPIREPDFILAAPPCLPASQRTSSVRQNVNAEGELDCWPERSDLAQQTSRRAGSSTLQPLGLVRHRTVETLHRPERDLRHSRFGSELRRRLRLACSAATIRSLHP